MHRSAPAQSSPARLTSLSAGRAGRLCLFWNYAVPFWAGEPQDMCDTQRSPPHQGLGVSSLLPVDTGPERRPWGTAHPVAGTVWEEGV